MYFNNEKKLYIAVIGDIVDSKKIKDRNRAQHIMADTLLKINQKYSYDIASKFMITLGDEFQGLLKSGKNLMKIIEQIEDAMYSIKIRFGIGIGEITTDINYEMPLGADGPAYYNARQMIEELKLLKSTTTKYNIKLKSDTESDILINTVFSLLYSIKRNWTERQLQIIYSMNQCNATQTELAEMYDITRSTVQQILKRADYIRYRNAMNTLEKVFSEIKEV